MVEHSVRDAGVAGSSPVVPISFQGKIATKRADSARTVRGVSIWGRPLPIQERIGTPVAEREAVASRFYSYCLRFVLRLH